MVEKLVPVLEVKTVNDGFCCIDGRATSYGYDDVGTCSIERLNATDDALDRCMLPNLRKGRSKGANIFQDSFDLADHVCLVDKFKLYVSGGDGVDIDYERSPSPGASCR